MGLQNVGLNDYMCVLQAFHANMQDFIVEKNSKIMNSRLLQFQRTYLQKIPYTQARINPFTAASMLATGVPLETEKCVYKTV